MGPTRMGRQAGLPPDTLVPDRNWLQQVKILEDSCFRINRDHH